MKQQHKNSPHTHTYTHTPCVRPFILLVNMYRRTNESNRQNHQSQNRGKFGGGDRGRVLGYYITSLLLLLPLLLLLSSVKLKAFKYYCNATLVFSHTRTFNTIWKSINKGWVPVLISLNWIESYIVILQTISTILLLGTQKSKNKMTNDLKVLVLGGKHFSFFS